MSRKPDDWMPLHIGKYLADTTHLTRDQHGAYLLLLMAYWRRGGPLPADDTRLAAIAKASPAEWRKLKTVLAEFFAEEGGLWVQKRAQEELAKANAMTQAKAQAGKKGAQKRWQTDGRQHGTAMAQPFGSHRQTDAPLPLPEQSPLPSGDSGEDKSSPGAAGASGRPAWWPVRDRYGRVTSEITEKIMFDVGKAVLGASAGGQVTRMRKAYSGDMRAVVDFLLQADEKSAPAEWFAGVLKRAERDQPQPPKHEIYPKETHH